MPNKKYTGIMPKPRPNYGAMKRSDVTPADVSREMSSGQVARRIPATPKPRPRRVYNGQTGMYSTD